MYVPPGVPLPLPEGQPLTSLVMTQALQDIITPDIALVSEVGRGRRGRGGWEERGGGIALVSRGEGVARRYDGRGSEGGVRKERGGATKREESSLRA